MLTRARSTIAAGTAAAMLAATSLAVVPTAQAAEQATYNGVPIIQVGGHNGWKNNGNWNKKWKYSNNYHHQHNNGSNIALGIFGFAAGALLGSALAQPHYPGNIDAYCSQKYRTYKPWTGTYTGYDHREHPCRYP